MSHLSGVASVNRASVRHGGSDRPASHPARLGARALRRPERRRRGLRPLLARATWPVRRVVDRAIGGFPCNLVGHRWNEVPRSLRSPAARAMGRLEFACRRCSTRAGFSN